MCTFHQRHEDHKQLERTVNTAVTRRGSKRVPDGERTVERRYLRQHMLETTRSGPEKSVKSRQTVIANPVHNLSFTGARHTQWYGGTKD
jgi:hypothetical protein